MSEEYLTFIKGVELRLLRCTLPPAAGYSDATPPPPPPTTANQEKSLYPLIESLVSLIERGRYAQVLSSEAARAVVGSLDSWEFVDSEECAARFYTQLEKRVEEFLRNSSEAWLRVLGSDGEDDGMACRCVLVMCVGIAAYLAFLQSNVTGPVGDFSSVPLLFSRLEEDNPSPSGAKWEIWACNQLTSIGSDLRGKFSLLQYIVLAKMLLRTTNDISIEGRNTWLSGTRSLCWWLCRLILLQQRILNELSSSLYDSLQVSMCETLRLFGNLETINGYWGCNLCEAEALAIVSMVHLEAGLTEHTYGRVDSSRFRGQAVGKVKGGEAFVSEEENANQGEKSDEKMVEEVSSLEGLWSTSKVQTIKGWWMFLRELNQIFALHLTSVYFNAAEQSCGLHLSVTGALGFRTVHQVDAKAQMILVASADQQKNGDRSPIECSELLSESSPVGNKKAPQSHEISDDCDILMTPNLVGNMNGAGTNGNTTCNGGIATAPLTAVQQAVILAQCLYIKRSNPDDELSGWRMAPFIEAIDAQQHSHFMIRCFCDILRIRWESTRSRTKVRSLLMLEKLVERVCKGAPGAEQRIHLSHAVYVPTIPSLRKDYGDLLVCCGMKGEALKIFEDLELWDDLIYCYRALGKKSAAVDLIKARLCDMPNDSRLWCSLGDVTNIDAHYEKALEVSNNRCARAKRSLAQSAYRKGDYATSILLWESSMALNSLYPDGWFSLGAAALKAQNFDKALDAFTRTVQLNPDCGEAWSNIAAVHWMKKRSKEASIAFKEALKFMRTNWQIWQMCSLVAMDVGNYSQALEATRMVLDLSANKQIDGQLLERLMLEVEERTGLTYHSRNSQTHPSNSDKESVKKSGCPEPGLEISRETEMLIDMLGSILQQIIRSGGRDDIWGLYARWHKIRGDLTMCSEALLKQVRSYQGSELWYDEERFKKFVRASLQLCEVYMEIASSTRSRQELAAAEMHLRNTIKQASKFSDTEEFRNLQACHDEIKRRLEVFPTTNFSSG